MNQNSFSNGTICFLTWLEKLPAVELEGFPAWDESLGENGAWGVCKSAADKGIKWLKLFEWAALLEIFDLPLVHCQRPAV